MPALFFLLIVVGGWFAWNEGDAELRWWCKTLAILAAVLFAVRWLVHAIAEHERIARHRSRIDRLQAFANDLQNGSLDARGFYSGGTTTVCGKLDGRDLQVSFRLAGAPFIAFEIRVKESQVELDALKPGVLERWNGSPLVITWTKGEPLREVEAPLLHLLTERGFERVGVSGGWVRAEVPLDDSDLRLEKLQDSCRTIARIARVCEPRRKTGVYDRPTEEGGRWTSSSRGERRS